MANSVILNGTTLNPTDVNYSEDKYEISKRMADASLRVAHRANKGKWELSWTNVHESKVNTIRAFYRIVGQMTFVNEFNESFTVVCPAGGFSAALSAENVAMNGIKYYNVSLTLEEV